MRYYDIKITDSGGGIVREYTSFVGGQTIAGALNVELDVPVVSASLPMGGGLVRVWGIPLADIGQANNLRNMNIQVFAGMQAGLPLANPAQAGLIAQGYIQQAFGNWIYLDQTLDIVIQPGTAPTGTPAAGVPPKPNNLVLNWQKGQPLATALKTLLSTAYPKLAQNISISPNLVQAFTEPAFFKNLKQLGTFINEKAQSIMGGTYPGIDLYISGTTVNVLDGTSTSSSPKTISIQFQDLIGQPTWIESPNINFKVVMRSDLSVGATITLPKTLVNNTQQAQSNLTNQAANFQGTFKIRRLRHVGNFRQPDADSWVSVVDAYPTTVNASAAAA